MSEIRLNKKGVEFWSKGSKINGDIELSAMLGRLRYDGLIPVNLRWADPISGFYVLEFPPTYRLIEAKKSYMNTVIQPGMRRLPVPWQVYVYNHVRKSFYFFCRTEQIRSLDDMLYHQYLPNVYRSGTPCGGPRGEYLVDDPLTSALRYIDGLWMTSFNGGNYINGSTFKGSNRELKKRNSSLMPEEMIEAGFDDFWPSKDVFAWLEEHEIDDLLDWEWQEAGTLREHLDNVSATSSPWQGLRRIINRLRED